MKQLVVLGGKGGTGKTTVVAALAHLLSEHWRLTLADADVDAPNLGILLEPDVLETEAFVGGKEAVIDATACIGCGRCQEVCRYEAVRARDGIFEIDPIACEGCAACFYECPVQCIAMEPVVSGEWHRSETRFGTFVHANLFPGQENSGKLVSTVRQQALHVAEQQHSDLVLIDGSPGIGCPVIAAITGVDMALMVTEPTLSGRHDLERILGVAEHFQVPAAVCINKSDLNPRRSQEIVDYCRDRGLPIVGMLPYDDAVTAAMRKCRPVTEIEQGAIGRELRALAQSLSSHNLLDL